MKIMVTHLNSENIPLNFREVEGPTDSIKLEMLINKAIRALLDDCLLEPGDSITVQEVQVFPLIITNDITEADDREYLR